MLYADPGCKVFAVLPKKVSWPDGFEGHVIWRALKSSTALRDLQVMAPNQEPKLGDVTLTVKTESFRAFPNDFVQLKLLPQVTLLLHPVPFPMSSSCKHLSSAIQPASYCGTKLLAWQDPVPVGVGPCTAKSSIPMERLLHPVLQTCSSFSLSAVCWESAHANRQSCGQIKAYGKVVFIWMSNVFPSWCMDPAASPLLANPCLLCPVWGSLGLIARSQRGSHCSAGCFHARYLKIRGKISPAEPLKVEGAVITAAVPPAENAL